MSSPAQRIDYLPIDSHGMIGNMETCALVGTEGTIDWMCYPQFNSSSVFGRILDCRKGGSFSIRAMNYTKTKQHYWPDTNILITRFMSKHGIGELIDFMPVSEKRPCTNFLIRKVNCIHGSMTFKVSCCPSFNYASDLHECKIGAHGKKAFFKPFYNPMNPLNIPESRINCEHATLYCSKPILKIIPVLPIIPIVNGVNTQSNTLSPTVRRQSMCMMDPYVDSMTGNCVECEFTIEEDESVTFVFGTFDDALTCPEQELSSIFGSKTITQYGEEMLNETLDYWHDWLQKCTYKGRWREQVKRSALALKLLTYEKTGAILAAASTSLPEGIGGVRNWDYRFTWIRDASFTLYSFMSIGFMEEATKFVKYLEARISEMNLKYKQSDEKGSPPPLQVMYSIDGEHELIERTIDHLSGYMNSKPVRIGNGAYDQLQLDIYGELMDSMYIYDKYGNSISYDFWKHLRFITNWVCNNWDEKDGKFFVNFNRIDIWQRVFGKLEVEDNILFTVES